MEGLKQTEHKKPLLLNEHLKQNGIENSPDIELNFFFNEHGTKEDAEKVLKELENYDVLAIEYSGWNEDMKAYINEISEKGYEKYNEFFLKKRYESNFPEYYNTLFDGIALSQKRIIFPDLHLNSEPRIKLGEILDTKKENSLESFPNKNLSLEENSIQYFNQYKKFVALQIQREKEIIANIPNEITSLLKEYPELKNKEKLRILFPVGAVHTSLYKAMKGSGIEVNRSSAEDNHKHNLLSSLTKLALHKGAERSDEYEPKLFVVYLLLIEMGAHSKSITLNALKSFSEEQVKELFECFKKSSSKEEFQNLIKTSEKLQSNERIARAFNLE